MIVSAGLEPRVLQPNGPRRKSRFAFVIHPLSQEFFRKVEPLGTIAKARPRSVMDVVEKAVAYAPPFVYSHVTGIKSPTGAEAEGWLITRRRHAQGADGAQPGVHLRPAARGRRDRPASSGAQVMGLGAFTKVVGDAGVTVAKQAPLPITTGNSYSASGALWAAHEALVRLGLAEVDERGPDARARRWSSAPPVPSARCAPGCWPWPATSCGWSRPSRPSCSRSSTTSSATTRGPRSTSPPRPTTHLADMDLIVTATSGAGKRVLDIMAVKPGCVITDVARPLDLSAEDVAKRPDVLVIESGEIELPGDVQMKNIGLPPGVAYACLAETVVLALEGRYETFTVGRNIEWEKVKEIYRLGLKHGMRLAAISGVNGVFTDEDLARIRELALERPRPPPPAERPGRSRRRTDPGTVVVTRSLDRAGPA